MPIVPENTYAAIDLGSNSFHLLVATVQSGQVKQIDKVKHMVRLAASLDAHKNISEKGLNTAWDCLALFAQRIRGIPNENIRVVGTNTLRQAKNADVFLNQAETILGQEIAIISGREEARMLYLGVAQSMSEHLTKKMVMDIGGGSTELILGQGIKTQLRESLHMGCVSFTRRFFENGEVSEKAWDSAYTHAMLQLAPLIKGFKKAGWSHAIGASGTMRATAKILVANGWSQTGINKNGLNHLKQHCLQAVHMDSLKSLPGLSERRQPVFIGGLVIVAALMDAFEIDHMSVSNGALREGLVYSMCGELTEAPVTQRSIKRLQKQFNVDTKQSKRLDKTIEHLISVSQWEISPNDRFLLDSAVQLHEIGLSISHSQFQKHGAYVVKYADLPGFSRQQQLLISQLILFQRRKLSALNNQGLTQKQVQRILPLLLLIRLASLLCRDREYHQVPIIELTSSGQHHALTIEQSWLNRHPLIKADLKDESRHWLSIGERFEWQGV